MSGHHPHRVIASLTERTSGRLARWEGGQEHELAGPGLATKVPTVVRWLVTR